MILASVRAQRSAAIPAGTYESKIDVRGKHDYSEGKLNVMLQFAAHTDPKVFEVVAEYLLVYQVPSRPEDQDAEAFARLNSPFNAWPYWRELLQSTVVRMGLPAPIVPLLRAR